MLKSIDSKSTLYFLNKINNKPPIVFIHGVGLTNEMWYPQINFFKSYNTLTYDLLGHGKTPLNKSKITLYDFSEQLLNLINELNFKKIHLIGFSLGALIARDFASKNNDRLCSLIIHGSIYKRNEQQKRIVLSRYNMAELNSSVSKKDALKRWFSESYINKNEEVYKKIYSILKNNNREDFLKSYKLFVNYEDNDDIIRKINVNTLITTGENDIGSTPEMTTKLSKAINNSKFIIIKNGKHLCSIECSKDVNIIFKQFIDANND